MKRLARAGRVIYVERRLGWSLALLGASLGFVLFAWNRPTPERRELGMALYYGVPLAIAALWPLVRTRALAIDVERRMLMVLERGLLMRTRKSIHDLSVLSVRLVSVPAAGLFGIPARCHFIWIDHAEGPSILFLVSWRGRDPGAVAARLAEDLGRPLTGVDRTRP